MSKVLDIQFVNENNAIFFSVYKTIALFSLYDLIVPSIYSFSFPYILCRYSRGHFEGRPKKRGALDRLQNKYRKDIQVVNGRINRIFN